MKIVTTVTAPLLSALLLSAAMAQSEDPSKDQDGATPSAQATFDSLDRNKDERLSKSEAAADDGLSTQFAALDANADGYINKGEYMRARRPTAPAPSDTVPVPDPQS
jgi:hypothetical protein